MPASKHKGCPQAYTSTQRTGQGGMHNGRIEAAGTAFAAFSAGNGVLATLSAHRRLLISRCAMSLWNELGHTVMRCEISTQKGTGHHLDCSLHPIPDRASGFLGSW